MTITNLTINKNSYSEYKTFLFKPTKNNFSCILQANSGGFTLILKEQGGGTRIAIQIWPEGMASIAVGENRSIIPPSTFPHIQKEKNEIWIDVHQDRLIRVRINRELFWKGDLFLNEPVVFVEGNYSQPLTLEVGTLFE